MCGHWDWVALCNIKNRTGHPLSLCHTGILLVRPLKPKRLERAPLFRVSATAREQVLDFKPLPWDDMETLAKMEYYCGSCSLGDNPFLLQNVVKWKDWIMRAFAVAVCQGRFSRSRLCVTSHWFSQRYQVWAQLTKFHWHVYVRFCMDQPFCVLIYVDCVLS